MDFNEDRVYSSGSGALLFGAIFMCNRHTKKECLNRKLFGLPPPQANFVKKIKAGMLLFLFEYEERKLYGVFQALSDGAMNIVPNAFKSSGKEIPAQIRFKTIWPCNPLSEQDFYDAIIENYYTPKKFNLGLSEKQVYKLLCLFNSRRVGSQKSQNLFPVKKLKNRPGNSVLGRYSVSENDSFIRTEQAEDTLRTANSLIDGQPRLSSIELPSVERVDPIWSTSLRDMDTEQGNDYHYYNYRSETSSARPGNSSFSRSQEISSRAGTENLNTSSMKLHSLDISTSPEDYIPLPSPDHFEPSEFDTLYSRNKSFVLGNQEDYEGISFPGVLGNHDNYKGLTFPESSLATIPFSSHGDFGRENTSSSFNPANGPSCVPHHRHPAISQRGYGFEGCKHMDYEQSGSFGVHPLDSQKGLGPDNHTNVPQKGLHSDIQKNRTSVFSRLTVSPKATGDDEDNANNVDISLNQLMGVLYQYQKCWGMSTRNSEHHKDDGCLELENTGKEVEVAACVSEEQQEPSESELPINFKRRSEVQKVQDKMRGCCEEKGMLLGTPLGKRRKLVRPSFVVEKLHDKGVPENMDGFQEGKGNLGSGVCSEKAPSHNLSADVVVCPVGFGGEKGEMDNVLGNQDFKVRVQAIVQELVGITNCSLGVEGSSDDVRNCIVGEHGKAVEGSDAICVKSGADAKAKGLSTDLCAHGKTEGGLDTSVKSEDDGESKGYSPESRNSQKDEEIFDVNK